MPSSNRSASRRFLQLLLVAALATASRAPFLARADRFFDADEAVEGLMARHVLHGEHPAFLWGQRYKGVPEVYLAAGLFAVVGPTVVALKTSTLLAFVAFVCLQFVLVERLFSTGVAWIATILLLVCPPSFVLWSLSANAEIVMTLLAGTTMCLGLDRWRRSGSRGALMLAAVAAGFGLWVHQYIIFYLVAAFVALVYGLPRRDELIGRFFDLHDMPAWLRWTCYVLTAGVLVYIMLGVAAFVSGGFDLAVGSTRTGVHHSQKMWVVAAALGCLWLVTRATSLVMTHRSWRPVAASALVAFLVGYAPALIARAAFGGSSPIGRSNLGSLTSSFAPLGQVATIVMGLRSSTTGWLDVPTWLTLAPMAAIVISFLAIRRSTTTPVFHFLVVVTPLIFLASGAFVDPQSYRYFMPAFGALSVVMALGVVTTFKWSRAAGIGLMAALVTLFGLEERAWYQRMTPDTARATIACLERAGIRTAYADYWLSYKLTFLSGERLIVAPNAGVDRYPPYTAQVRAQPSAPTVAATIGGPCISALPLLQ